MPTKEINDGEERAAQYSELVIELLDTPEVQRTKKIINNGFCSEGFPSISHPRKLHLIGTAKKARLAYEAMQRNGSNLSDSFLSVMESLGILHDTGHAPFAHALRNVIKAISGKSHEQVSAEIVTGKLSFFEYFSARPHLLGNPEYAKAALEHYSTLPTVPQILRKYVVDIDLVAELLHTGITQKPLHPNVSFLKEVIDGGLIDIDKMDYIPRDAKNANIEESQVNPGRILNGLKVVEQDGGRHLAVMDTSLDDLCMWVSARKYLYQNIYTHKTVLKYEAMMTEAVKRSIPYFKDNGIEIHLLTDDRLFNLLMQSNPVSAQLVMDVQFGRKKKYSEAYTIKSRKIGDPKEYAKLMGLRGYIKSQEADFPEDVVRDEIVKLAGDGIESHEVLVYFPYEHKTTEQWKEKLDLLVYSHNGPSQICNLRDMAEGTASLVDSKAQDILYELCKPESSVYFAVYAKPEHREAVAKATAKFVEGIKEK